MDSIADRMMETELTGLPFDGSRKRIFPSFSPVTRSLPSLEKAADSIPPHRFPIRAAVHPACGAAAAKELRSPPASAFAKVNEANQAM